MSVITDIVSGIAGTIGKAAIDIRTAITGVDPATAGKLAEIAANLEAQKEQAESDLLKGQLEINKVEAGSTNLFISGARPAILWIGALVILYSYVAVPLLKAVGAALPDLNLSDLWPVITGILGLGGMRTYEKVQGVQNKH